MRALRARLGCAWGCVYLLSAPAFASSPPDPAAEEPQLIWVFFDEAAAAPGADATSHDRFAQRLAARARELAPRCLKRRARSRIGPVVDARDLAPDPHAVGAVLATGAQLRITSRWFNAVSVRASAEQREALEALSFVDHTSVVRRHRATPQPPWILAAPGPSAASGAADHALQLENLGADFLHACGLSGAGVLVGVQDSGFDLSHPALQAIDVVAAYDFVDDDAEVGPQADDAANQHAHGTMVLSLLAGFEADGDAGPPLYSGVAPQVSVVLTKTEDVSQEMPFEEDLYVAGLEFIEAQGADLFTASLGYIDWYAPEDLDGQSAVTSLAVDIAVANGLIVLNAVGNGGGDGPTLIAPADAYNVLSIGAVDPRGALSGFSSWGPTADGRLKPELLAPGEDVYVADYAEREGYFMGNGTSFATPLAAGLVALLLEAEPGLSPAAIRDRLQSTANPASNPGVSPANGYGHGLIDGQKAAPMMCACLDVDQDGVLGLGCGGLDCDDTDAQIQPGAQERCNRLDDDCDGALRDDELDTDRDGWAACEGDCEDEDSSIHPGKAERCDNGIDDNCDGLTDLEDAACASGETGETGGASEAGTAGGNDLAGPASGCACAAEGPRPGRGGWLIALCFVLLSPAGRRRAKGPCLD